MHVIDLLSPFGTAVDADTVSALAVAGGLGDLSRGQETPTDVLDLALFERLNPVDVALRNHEYMQRRLRIDVSEREHVIVFVLDVGGAVSGDDAAEEAIGDRSTARASRHSGVVIIRAHEIARRSPMGTCPKCKLRIRRNGNHVKLGSIWYHKACPGKSAPKTTKPAAR